MTFSLFDFVPIPLSVVEIVISVCSYPSCVEVIVVEFVFVPIPLCVEVIVLSGLVPYPSCV